MRKTNIIFTSGHADAINPNQSDRRFFPVFDSSQVRRPEVLPLAERLHEQHPSWSAKKCLEQAKLLITRKKAPAEVAKAANTEAASTGAPVNKGCN